MLTFHNALQKAANALRRPSQSRAPAPYLRLAGRTVCATSSPLFLDLRKARAAEASARGLGSAR